MTATKKSHQVQSGRRGPVATLPLLSVDTSVSQVFEAMKRHRHAAAVVRDGVTYHYMSAAKVKDALESLPQAEGVHPEAKIGELIKHAGENIAQSNVPDLHPSAWVGEKPTTHRFSLLGKGLASVSVNANESGTAFWKEPQPTICYCKNCHRAVKKGTRCCGNPDLICVP